MGGHTPPSGICKYESHVGRQYSQHLYIASILSASISQPSSLYAGWKTWTKMLPWDVNKNLATRLQQNFSTHDVNKIVVTVLFQTKCIIYICMFLWSFNYGTVQPRRSLGSRLRVSQLSRQKGCRNRLRRSSSIRHRQCETSWGAHGPHDCLSMICNL